MNGTAEHKYKLKIGTIYSPVLSDSSYTNEMDKVLIFLLLMMGLMVTISESFFISRRDLRRSWNLLPRWFHQPKQEDRQDYGSEERDRADDLSSDRSHGSSRHSKRFHHHHKKTHHHCGHSHDHDHYHDDHYYKSKYNDDHYYKSKYNDDNYRTKYNNDEHYKNRSNEDKRDEEDYYEDDKRNVQQKRKNEEQPKRREKPPRTSRTSTTAGPAEDYQDQQQDDDGGNGQQQQPQQPQQHQYRYANHPTMQYKKDYVAGVLVTIPNIRNGDDLEPYFQRAKYSNPFFETFLKDGQEYAQEETIARPLYYNFE